MRGHLTVKYRAITGAGRADATEVRILSRMCAGIPMVKEVGLSHEPDFRHADRQVFASGEREGSDDSISQAKVGRGDGDVPAAGRIADTLFFAVVIRQRICCKTDPICRSQQKSWRKTCRNRQKNSITNLKRLGRYFEETSTTCSTVRRTDIHRKRCATGRVW